MSSHQRRIAKRAKERQSWLYHLMWIRIAAIRHLIRKLQRPVNQIAERLSIPALPANITLPDNKKLVLAAQRI